MVAGNQRSRSLSISPPPTKRRRTERSVIEPEQTSKSSLTVYSWNVNGIQPFLQQPITSFFSKEKQDAGAKISLRDFLKRHNWPHILFLQEVKINPEDSSTMHAVERAVKRSQSEPADAHDYEAHFCLPSDQHNARGFGRKVYGVCSILRRDFRERLVERVRPVDWDREGRFSVIETGEKDGFPKMAIINVYAVNGTSNPYKDSETGQVVGTRHDRKLEVHKRLQSEARMLQEQGFQVIIAGDLNIARTRNDGHPNLRTFPQQHCINRADFETRFFGTDKSSKAESSSRESEQGLGMVDTFRELHRAKKGYTYYPRTRTFGVSCDRVDMILASQGLRHALVEAGMHETPSDRGPSDHVPLFASFNLDSAAESKSSSPSR